MSTSNKMGVVHQSHLTKARASAKTAPEENDLGLRGSSSKTSIIAELDKLVTLDKSGQASVPDTSGQASYQDRKASARTTRRVEKSKIDKVEAVGNIGNFSSLNVPTWISCWSARLPDKAMRVLPSDYTPRLPERLQRRLQLLPRCPPPLPSLCAFRTGNVT